MYRASLHFLARNTESDGDDDDDGNDDNDDNDDNVEVKSIGIKSLGKFKVSGTILITLTHFVFHFISN